MRFAEVDAEAVALREAARAQRMRHAIAAAFDLAERVLGPVPFERDVIAARDQREVEEMEEVHDPQITQIGRRCARRFGDDDTKAVDWRGDHRGGNQFSRVGTRASRSERRHRRRGLPAASRSRRVFSRRRRERARRHALPVSARWRRHDAIPIRLRGFSRMGRMALPRSSIRGAFAGRDRDWRGVPPRTRKSSTRCTSARSRAKAPGAAAIERACRAARDLGITLIEVMPVAEFPGRFGWGYDGVDLFAPTRLYGTPDDFRRFVDRAHAVGLGVILDVVYNHFGPDGNYLRAVLGRLLHRIATRTIGATRSTSMATNAGPRARVLHRQRRATGSTSFISTACGSTPRRASTTPRAEHILAAIVRRGARRRRRARASSSSAKTSRRKRSSCGRWSRAAMASTRCGTTTSITRAIVALTGRRRGLLHRLSRARRRSSSRRRKWGFLYQGQYYSWQKDRRGTPASHLPPATSSCFLQNHDQVANSARGQRCTTSPTRAASAR